MWVGFDTPATLGNNETGAAVAAPVWHDFMAAALKDRPKLTFTAPPDMTIASYDSGFGTVTDAFKPGQVPGGSAPLGDLPVPGEADSGAAGPAAPGSTAAAAPAAAGVDNGLGGLY